MKPLIQRNPFFRFFALIFYECIAIPLLWVYARIVFGISICGKKNIRKLKHRGAVLVCNHVNTLDCTFIGILAAPRKVVYTAMESIFDRPFIGPLIHFLGAVPVPAPNSPPSKMLGFTRQMASAVGSGRFVCVYPEGELIPYDSNLREFKNGAFMIAAMAKAPVIPIVITARKRKGIWKILKHRHPCLTITAGTPLNPIPQKDLCKTAVKLRDRTVKVMKTMLYCLKNSVNKDLPLPAIGEEKQNN